jgi:tetratricopeptide (TPR) repeat protein
MALFRFFAARLAGITAACLMLAAAPALADEVQAITRQFSAGDLDGALTRADAYLVKHPQDAQMRFLKGLILADQGATGEAIAVFTALTEEFPELPEPYNNLAVLYAAQDQFQEAQFALEAAIRAYPDYATAHENLGDIYARMAWAAYDKALALDGKNAAAQAKLAQIKSMLGAQQLKSGMSPAISAPPAPVAHSVPPAPAR